MSAKIRVAIVDDFADTRESITKLLFFERDIEVVGAAPDAEQGIRLIKDIRPDIVLMDINMPGMDGIAATEIISSVAPESAVIMMSVQGEADYLRRAMLAGAREYLVKPFTGDELAATIRHVNGLATDKRARMASMAPPPTQAHPSAAVAALDTGRIISVFSPKGGVGRTTVACNLALALRFATGKRVALVDCSLAFGDVGIVMNLSGSKSVADLAPAISSLDREMLESVMVEHSSGVRVLLAPPRPELADLVMPDHLRAVLSLMSHCYDYVVVDTHPSLDDAMLAVLDLSDRVVLLTTLEMPAIKNVKLFLGVVDALQYPEGKVMLVVNRSDSAGGIAPADVEASIRVEVSSRIVSAGQLMTSAINQGVPVAISHRESPVSRGLFDLARKLMAEDDQEAATGEDGAGNRDRQEGRSGQGRFRMPSFGGFVRKGVN